jgi:hypothetical protein
LVLSLAARWSKLSHGARTADGALSQGQAAKYRVLSMPTCARRPTAAQCRS